MRQNPLCSPWQTILSTKCEEGVALSNFNIEERKSWAERRSTTLELIAMLSSNSSSRNFGQTR